MFSIGLSYIMLTFMFRNEIDDELANFLKYDRILYD